MTLKLEMENLFSSDIILYDTLVEAQKTNPILKEHNISFPNRINSENYGIFVGQGRNVLTQRTTDSDIYDSHISVVITNKNTDYKLAKTGIDIATKEIIKVIKNSILNNRQFRWTESDIVYIPPVYNIKYRRLDLIFAESYSWDKEKYDSGDLELLFGDVDIDNSVSEEKLIENEILEIIEKMREYKEQGIDLFPFVLNDIF